MERGSPDERDDDGEFMDDEADRVETLMRGAWASDDDRRDDSDDNDEAIQIRRIFDRHV